MSSSGIVPINGGSVILRTYLDESAENTYLLQQYDVPISSNRILITSTNGLLISTTTINVSSVGTSSIFANTVSTNQLFICTIYYSTFTSSQLNYENTIANNISASTINFITMRGGTISTLLVNTKSLGINDGTFSTLIVPSLTVSSINVDRLTTINGRYNTLIGPNMKLNILSTIFFYISSVFVDVVTYDIISSKTITASTLFAKNDRFTNATGKILETSILIAPSVTTKSVVFSTMVLGSFYELRQFAASEITTSSLYSFKGECSTIMIGSTIGGSTIFTPPLNVYNNQVVSSATGNSILISTLTTASTLYGSNNVFTTLTGSSTFATNAIVPSLTTNSIQFSTIYTPTANIPLVYTSTLIIPTVFNTSLTVSTMIAGTTYASTVITSSISVNTYYINQPVYGQTIKKDSIDVFTNVQLSTIDYVAKLDNPPSYTQLYTFGPTIQNQWIVGGRSNSYLNGATSNNGTTWTGFGFPILLTINGIVWTGNRWVATGNGNGNGNSIITSINGTNWTSRGQTLQAQGSSPQATLTVGTSVSCWGNYTFVTGIGSGCIGFSTDNGVTWFNNTVPSGLTSANEIVFNGRRAVVVGGGSTTSIAWTDTLTQTWNPVVNSNQNLLDNGYAVIWTGRGWVAGGIGDGVDTTTIVYSSNGATWTKSFSGQNIFEYIVSGFGWNGTMLIAVGSGNNHTMGYSMDEGITWIGLGRTIFTSASSVTWNGQMWVATGTGPNTIAYSYNGINWYGSGNSAPDDVAYCAAFNFRRPYFFLSAPGSQVASKSRIPDATDPFIVPAGSQLDIVSDSYYNSGYTNFSAVFQTNAI